MSSSLRDSPDYQLHSNVKLRKTDTEKSVSQASHGMKGAQFCNISPKRELEMLESGTRSPRHFSADQKVSLRHFTSEGESKPLVAAIRKARNKSEGCFQERSCSVSQRQSNKNESLKFDNQQQKSIIGANRKVQHLCGKDTQIKKSLTQTGDSPPENKVVKRLPLHVLKAQDSTLDGPLEAGQAGSHQDTAVIGAARDGAQTKSSCNPDYMQQTTEKTQAGVTALPVVDPSEYQQNFQQRAQSHSQHRQGQMLRLPSKIQKQDSKKVSAENAQENKNQMNSLCLTERDGKQQHPSGSNKKSPRLNEGAARAVSQGSGSSANNDLNSKLINMSSARAETIENTSNSLISERKGGNSIQQSVSQSRRRAEGAAEPCSAGVDYLMNSSRQEPSHSDYTNIDDADDYQSYWATISRTTDGGQRREDEEMTENSEIFHQTQMRSSHYGTVQDLDASFHCSESMWGAHDSSFVTEDDQNYTFSSQTRTPTGSFQYASISAAASQQAAKMQRSAAKGNKASAATPTSCQPTQEESKFDSQINGANGSVACSQQALMQNPCGTTSFFIPADAQAQPQQIMMPAATAAQAGFQPMFPPQFISQQNNYVGTTQQGAATSQSNQYLHPAQCAPAKTSKAGINFTQPSAQQLQQQQSQRQRTSFAQSMQPSYRPQTASSPHPVQQSFNLYPQQAPLIMPPSPTASMMPGALVQKSLQQLAQLQAMGQLGIPDSLYQSYLEDTEKIADKNHRLQAQQAFVQEMYRLHHQVKQMQKPAQPTPALFQRDSSNTSSVSSKNSSCSSNTRSSNSASMKLQLQSAVQHYHQLERESDRTRFLIEKGYLFARDKASFQILQKQIEKEIQPGSTRRQQCPFIEELLTELLRRGNFHKMMMHPIANFLCQMLIRYATLPLLEKVLFSIKQEFSRLGMDQHGTRALQTLLEELMSKRTSGKAGQQAVGKQLVECLQQSGRIVEMMTNVRGNHVVKQVLQLMTPEQRQKHLFSVVLQNFETLTTDKHGCQVIQDCLKANQSHESRRRLVQQCQRNMRQLVNHEFGNFVVSATVESFNLGRSGTSPASEQAQQELEAVQGQISDFVCMNLVALAKEQFASRVVETLLKSIQQPEFERLCQQNFVDAKGKRTRLFKELLFDQYGNYIAVKLIDNARDFEMKKVQDHFARTFREAQDQLKKCRHGRQLIQKIEQTQQHWGSYGARRGQASSSSSSVASKVSSKMSQSSNSYNH